MSRPKFAIMGHILWEGDVCIRDDNSTCHLLFNPFLCPGRPNHREVGKLCHRWLSLSLHGSQPKSTCSHKADRLTALGGETARSCTC
jgi:hypothetical protein